MLTCAISKELWMQLWFPFPTVEVSLIHKVIIRVIVCWKCPRGREDGLFVIFNCILSTGASLVLSSCSQLFTSRPSSFPLTSETYLCSRTVPEIEKALTELKRLMEYRILYAENEEQKAKEQNFMGLGLTSRKNLCINPEVILILAVRDWQTNSPNWKVAKEKKGKVVDARCRDLTNSASCEKGRADPGSVELCDWHEVCHFIGFLTIIWLFMVSEPRKYGGWQFNTSRNMDFSRRLAIRSG